MTAGAGASTRATLRRRAKYDSRVELVLMRSGSRLGVEYRRFIQGKLALKGFVAEEPWPTGYGEEPAGDDDVFRPFDPVGIPEPACGVCGANCGSIRFSNSGKPEESGQRTAHGVCLLLCGERHAIPCSGRHTECACYYLLA